MAWQSLRLARGLALALPLALLAGAYLSEYGFGLFPCEMCWWQRYPHFLAAALAALAFAVPTAARTLVALSAAAMLVSGLIGGFHAGVEYGWWPGVTGCSTHAFGRGDDALEAIMNAPLIRCDVAPWSLLGVSLAGWNFLFSVAGAFAIGLLLVIKRKAAR